MPNRVSRRAAGGDKRTPDGNRPVLASSGRTNGASPVTDRTTNGATRAVSELASKRLTQRSREASTERSEGAVSGRAPLRSDDALGHPA